MFSVSDVREVTVIKAGRSPGGSRHYSIQEASTTVQSITIQEDPIDV